ncbi:MAG: RDD family protein, partial [Planctomycetia bacterium]
RDPPQWAYLVVNLVNFLSYWLYEAGMTCSSRQATFGKSWLGMTVTDLRGRRIGFWRATGRWAAKMLSALPMYLGFLMVGLTSRNQGLHDKLAGTLVLRRG